jgi:hypothetical protein
MQKKQLTLKALHAIILTVFTAGSVHLVIAAAASILRQDLSIINPINFLGLQLLFPGLAHSFPALILGWCVLIGLGLLYLSLLVHFKRYLAVISSTVPYQKMQRMRQTTARIQAVLANQGRAERQLSGSKTIKERIGVIIAKYQDVL